MAYFAAGRSSRLDGGIRLYALHVETGELLHQADVKVPGGQGENIIRQSVLPDILSMQHDTIWMRSLGLDKTLAPVPDRAAPVRSAWFFGRHVVAPNLLDVRHGDRWRLHALAGRRQLGTGRTAARI